MDNLATQLDDVISEKGAIDFGPALRSTTFDDLGLDSIHLIEVADWIKERTGVPIPDELIVADGTADGILRYVTEAGAA